MNFKNIILLFIPILTILSCGGSYDIIAETCSAKVIDAIPTGTNQVLVWADEFDFDGSPCSDNWTYDLGAGGWGNGEAQNYTNRVENVIVKGGFLKITAKKEVYQNSQYTSTRMLSMGKFDFTYGKVEVRAKLPSGKGTWPAIWMLGANFKTVGWPTCGEIDIMEHAGNRQGTISSAMHTPSSHGNTSNVGSQTLADVSTAFHIYAVEWTSEKMTFSVDGVVHYTYNPATKNSSTWPFNDKQFLILNVAMGGSFGGGIDAAFIESSMEIDYVRVYQ
ncbi:MAG: glycoside hydrolase family 16 protein [Lutibacter sp.]|nr:glycoside hydrolase family 16 protein [Lutibacter sp.]